MSGSIASPPPTSFDSPSQGSTAATSSSSSSSTPTTASNLNATLINAKDTVVSNAQATMASIQNSSTVQSISNGPVAENVKNQASLTTSEFQTLAGARNEKPATAATGQPLTHYHSMFYSLLSWEHPRATGIAFASSIASIFLLRYVNVLHYAFKVSYFILGITSALEVAGKLLFDDGFASKMRPRKYWTVPRESLEQGMDEVEQLVNFFVLEAQRIVYAENIYATLAVFFAALISYGLIRIVPFWGLAVLATSVTFLAPLVYKKNQRVIDRQIEDITKIVSSQATQIKEVAAHHTSQATESVKTYAGEYTQLAQEYMGQAKATVSSTVSGNTASGSTVSGTDFPSAPKTATSSDFPAAPKSEPTPASEILTAEPPLHGQGI